MKIIIQETVSENPLTVMVTSESDALKVDAVLRLVHRALNAASFTDESIHRFMPLDRIYENPPEKLQL